MPEHGPRHRITSHRYYKRAEWVWYAASIGYDVLWIGVFGTLLSPYGVNIAVLAVIVICCTVPYAIGTAQLVRAVIEKRSHDAIKWGLLVSAAFFAPDVYVLASSGRRMPWYLLVGFITWVSVAATIGTRHLLAKIREARTEPAPPEAAVVD